MELNIIVHNDLVNGDIFILNQELKYKDLTIPQGFSSDGCSVPRLLWFLVFPPLDRAALRGGIIHDYIYRTHPAAWHKNEADVVFYNLLIEDNVSLIRALLAYWGVKLFGRKAWER